MKKQQNITQKIKKFCVKKWLGKSVYNRGLEIWCKLDNELPPAVGALINDEARVAKFAHQVQKLSYTDRYALRTWLEDEVYTLTHFHTEFQTLKQEEIDRRLCQIYKQHLSALNFV